MLADRSPTQTNPLLGVLAKLLDLADGRAEASRVLDLLASDPVRRRFGFSEDHLETITRWVTRAGIRWAWDQNGRDRYGLAAFQQNTWRFGVDRVLSGVALSDDLPAGGDLDWSIENQTGISGCTIPGAVGSQSIDCPTVSLDGGDSYAIHIVSDTSVASADTVPNTASVSSENAGSDEDSDTITINKSAIDIVKTADDPSVEAGDTIGFTVTVTNNGAATATGVLVNDPLPNDPGLSWTLDDNAGGLCSLAANTVTCGPTTLAPGASFSFHISSPTTDDTAETSPVLNVASVTTENAGSDEDDADVVIEGGEVAPATGTPRPTLPPTDASGSVSGPGPSLLLVLIGLAALTLGVGVLTPVPATIRRRRDR
jgi:uncharacterized repeat protein (TIGR01451 family)